MSSMLEQAIIDAAALREAALKNAEQSLIEKYAPQIKEAVETMLDSDIIKEGRKIKYEGRIAQVTTEADSSGMVGISEGGKTYLVKESELQELSDDELLQEEDMDLGAPAGATPATSIQAPFLGNPTVQPDEVINLSIDVDAIDDEIDINLDDLERELAGATMPEDDLISIGDMAGEEAGFEDLAPDEENLLGGEEEFEEPLGAPEDEEQLQELLNLLEEYETETLEEKVGPGGPQQAVKPGWIETAYFQNEEQDLIQQVADNLYPEEEEDDSEDETDEPEPVAPKLYETIDLLKSQNKEFETIVYKLSDKLEETLLSNAKFLYQNRTLCDASLNERQKEKIVEAIAKAESPKEAKHLHEALKTTMGSEKKKGPQSLSESVNRRGNLSGILNRRQNFKESQTDEPFKKKMQKLAGIK